MDASERARYKQLANDSIIATFGRDDNEARLAQALEKCVDELEDANDKCPTCSVCENHGDHDDETVPIDGDRITQVHKELKESLKALKDYHVKLSGETVELEPELTLADDLAEIIEELEESVNELEAEILP